MKILHIIYDDIHNPWCGGGGAYRAHKINSFLSPQHEVTVFTGSFPGGKDESIEGIRYKRIGLKHSYILSRLSFSILVPFFIRKCRSDILVNDCSFFAPCFADIHTRRPVINIFHHLMGKHAIRLYPLFGIFPYIAEKIFLKTARNIITPTRSVKNQVLASFPSKKVKVIPNGISDDLFELKPEDGKFVLFLGRIDIYMKGIDLLITSFSKIKNLKIKLIIAGSGKPNDIKSLKELIKKHNLQESVKYLGRVDRETKFELLRTCSFLVMPSRFEGWGITGMEANAAGKAVLGTKIQGLTEALVEDRTAVLVDSENPHKLVEGMYYLLGNKNKREEMGKEGRIYAQRFSWEKISLAQIAFYRQVI